MKPIFKKEQPKTEQPEQAIETNVESEQPSQTVSEPAKEEVEHLAAFLSEAFESEQIEHHKTRHQARKSFFVIAFVALIAGVTA